MILAWTPMCCPHHEVLGDLGVGVFTAGIIGGIILWYEEIREDEREARQFKRDRELALAIRSDANEESDRRSLADYLLVELKPLLDDLQYEANFVREFHPDDRVNERMRLSVLLYGRVNTAGKLIRRCGDTKLNEAFGEYESKPLNLMREIVQGPGDDLIDRIKVEAESLQKEFEEISSAAEELLENSTILRVKDLNG